MGAITAFFLLFFAMSPALEAVACAAEGCDFFCADPAETGAQASDNGSSTSDNCIQGNCACVAGHCSHNAIPAPETFTSVLPVIPASVTPFVTEGAVSGTPQTPERPPRA